MLVSQRKYAQHRGVALSAVQKAIASGRIKLHNGKVDVEEADRDWQENTRAGILKRGVSKVQQLEAMSAAQAAPKPKKQADPPPRKRGRPRKQAVEDEDEEFDAPHDSGDDERPKFGKKPPKSPRNIQEELLWSEHYDREKKRLLVEQKRGALVPAHDVEKQWFQLCRNARDLLLAIPGQICDQLASEMDAQEVHRKLEAALVAALEELAAGDAEVST